MRALIPNTHLAVAPISRMTPFAEGASATARPSPCEVPSASQRAARYGYEDIARVEPIVLPTEAGVHLAREHASAWTRGAVILVYTVAVLALGIVGGQVLQQLVTNAHAYAAAARV